MPASNFPSGLSFWGIYTRHAKSIVLENVHLALQAPDTRHAIICNDVEDLTIDAFQSPPIKNAAAQLFLQNVQNADIRACRPGTGTGLFLKVSGEKSDNIILLNNDFGGVKRVFSLNKNVRENSVKNRFNFPDQP